MISEKLYALLEAATVALRDGDCVAAAERLGEASELVRESQAVALPVQELEALRAAFDACESARADANVSLEEARRSSSRARSAAGAYSGVK